MKRIIAIIAFLLPFTACFSQTWENVGNGLNNNIYDINRNVYDLQKFHNKLYACGRCGVQVWNDTGWTILPNIFGVAYPGTLATYNDTLYAGGDEASWSAPISHVYKFDGTSWIQVGGDFNDSDPSELWTSTQQLLPFNGQLISGGHYTSINAITIYNIASWNGTTWSSLGNGLNDVVACLAEYNGQLFASGNFTASGSDTTIRYIAKWSGTKWLRLDTTFSFHSARAMISFGGSLIIGDVWDTINGTPMKGIAAWNGTAFTSMGNNLIHTVNNFWVFNNELYMCGDLYTLSAGYENVVLKWTGSFWQQVGTDFNQPVLTVDDFNNQLFCGGFFTSPASYVSKLNTATGISELDKQIAFQFYPNPANSTIKIFTDEQNMDLKIFDVLGNKVLETNRKEIDVSSLSNGVYFLQVGNNTQKFIVQH